MAIKIYRFVLERSCGAPDQMSASILNLRPLPYGGPMTLHHSPLDFEDVVSTSYEVLKAEPSVRRVPQVTLRRFCVDVAIVACGIRSVRLVHDLAGRY